MFQARALHGITKPTIISNKSSAEVVPARSSDVLDTFRSETLYVTNDWKENPDGSNYTAGLDNDYAESGEGRSDLLARMDNRLSERIKKVQRKWADNGYGETAGELGLRENVIPAMKEAKGSGIVRTKPDRFYIRNHAQSSIFAFCHEFFVFPYLGSPKAVRILEVDYTWP